MGYVEDLRAIIGHRPIILNGSIVIIQNPQGEVLLQQRQYPKGTWGIPGGLMELEETTEEAARREILEETGLTLGQLTLFGVYSGKKYLMKAKNGDLFYAVTTVYTTSEYFGDVAVTDHESISFEWRSQENFPTPFAKTQADIIADYFARFKK